MPAPVLIACAHGTRDPEGRATVRALVEDVRGAQPGCEVREAFVDVETPRVGDVLADALAPGGATAVVVPLLLSPGYHVHVDIAEAVAVHGARAAAAEPLGADPRVAEVLLRRLAEVGTAPGDAVVVAAAGSSDARSHRAVEAVAARVATSHPGPVSVGYGSAAAPNVGSAVTAARSAGAGRVVVASYLLAPGHFLGRLAASGADVVTAPLAPHPLLVAAVLARYRACASGLGGAPDAALPSAS